MTNESGHGMGNSPENRKGEPAQKLASRLPSSRPDGKAPQGRKRGRWRLNLVSAGLVFPLTLLALALYLLAPDLLTRQRSAGGQPLPLATQTPVSKADTRATPALGSGTGKVAGSSDLGARLAQASDLTRRSRFEESAALYASLAEERPKDPQVEAGWAWALLLEGRAKEGLEHARRAVELEPLSGEAMTVLAKGYLAMGDAARGLGIGQSAVELDSSSSRAHAVLAEAYWADGQVERAVEEAELAVARDPDSADAHSIRGRLYISSDRDPQSALEDLQLAADLEPELWQRRLDLGGLLLQLGMYEEARSELEQALALRRNGEVYAALAETHYWLGNGQDASQYLDQARLAGADEAGIHAVAAAINAQVDRCEESRVYYNRVLAKDPASQLALAAKMACEGEPQTLSTEAGPSPTATAMPSLEGRIAFPVWNEDSQQYDVYVSRADGSQRQLVVDGARQPAFSPSGDWLAVNGGRHLQENLLVLQPGGSEVREITEHAEDGLPAWSPDGLSLVFSSTQHGDRQSRVYVVDTIPLDGRKESGRALQAGPADARGAYPSWAGAGQVVYSGCDYTGSPAVCGILRMATEPGMQVPLPVTDNPADTAPASHGDQVAFMSSRDGNWDLYIVNSDGTGLRRLTSDASSQGLPAWSPEGRTLVFVSDQGGQWAVWAMAPDGSGQKELFEIGGGGLGPDWQQERISWAP